MFVFLFLSVFLCFNVGQVLESCIFLSNCNVICFVCFICTFQQINILFGGSKRPHFILGAIVLGESGKAIMCLSVIDSPTAARPRPVCISSVSQTDVCCTKASTRRFTNDTFTDTDRIVCGAGSMKR